MNALYYISRKFPEYREYRKNMSEQAHRCIIKPYGFLEDKYVKRAGLDY